MIIRELAQRDIAPAAFIVKSIWGEEVADKAAWQMGEAFRPVLNRPIYFVAEMFGEVVGFAGLRLSWMMADTYEFTFVAVAKKFQGRGIGQQLTERRLEEADNRGASLVMVMSKQQEFFERFGFRVIADFDGQRLMALKLGHVGL